MDFRTVCYTLLLLTCTGVSFGQELLLPERMNMKVGEDLVITPISIINASRLATKWYCNRTLILTEAPAGVIIQPPYTGRVSLNTTTLALTLRSLTENDTGQYSLEMITVPSTNTSVTSVHVLVAASNVAIVTDNTEVELNSTVTLVCSATGSSLSFIWRNGSSDITAGERVQLTNNNTTLTITRVIGGDTGPYQCEASNIVSKDLSPPLLLKISTIEKEPGAETLSAGAIAGISIGVLLGVAGIVVLIFFLTKERKPAAGNEGNEYEQDEWYVNLPNNQSGVTPGGSQPDGGGEYENVLHEQKG